MRRIDYTVSGDLKHSPETQTVHANPNKSRSSPVVYREIVQLKPYRMTRYRFQQQKMFTSLLDWLNKQDFPTGHSVVTNQFFTSSPSRSDVYLNVPERRTSDMFPVGTGEFSDLELFIRNYEELDTN